MSEFALRAFSTETDILNKGIGRNIPSIYGTSLDPNTSHSIWNLSNWTGGGGGGDEGPSEAEQAAAAEAALQVRKDKAKTDLEEAFSGYGLKDKDSPYFKDIARRYTNFAMNAPVTGIKDQRGDAMKELIAQLARQGKLDSTVRTDRESLAKKLYAKGQVDAALKGRGIGEGVRGTLSEAKEQGLADIRAATDPESAAQSAMSGIMAKTDPGTFDPVLDVFLKLTQGLAMRQEVERRRDRQAQIDSYLAGDRSKLIG